MRTRRSAVVPALGLALALFGGCRSVTPQPDTLARVRVANDADTYRLRRVGLVPFTGELADAELARAMQAAFLGEFSQRDRFELVLLDAADLAEIPASEPHRRGWYRPSTIVSLGKRFRLDGLLVGSVTHMQPYPPQELGLELELVSCETGMVLWTSSLQLDASADRVRRSLDWYRENHLANDEESPGTQVALIAPTFFARFAAYEMARGI